MVMTMVYEIFSLEGTDVQQQILREGLERIKFPWAKLTGYSRPILIGWKNLNAQHEARMRGYLQASGIYHDDHVHEPDDPDKVPGHVDLEDEYGHGHGIVRYVEGRWLIAGVFYPGSGRIFVDTSLEQYPADAQEVVSAEIAHLVDYGLPMTDTQRGQVIKIFHPDNADTHTWWEVQNYGSEYYTLVGESFMALFTHAYSDMEPWQAAFTHKSTKDMAPVVWGILDIRRTDMPEPEPEPVSEPEPTPESAPEGESFFRSGSRSKVYHKVDSKHGLRLRHQVVFSTEQEAVDTGLRRCKVCW